MKKVSLVAASVFLVEELIGKKQKMIRHSEVESVRVWRRIKREKVCCG